MGSANNEKRRNRGRKESRSDAGETQTAFQTTGAAQTTGTAQGQQSVGGGLLDTNLATQNSNLTAQTREVNDDELSSTHLAKLTGQDSEMRQRAEAFGKNYSTSRGLLDSSLGADHAFGAFVDRVSPFALADADKYTNVADKNLQYTNEFRGLDKQFGHNSLLQKDDQSWRSGENTLDRELTASEGERTAKQSF